jgi:hypothetical protein
MKAKGGWGCVTADWEGGETPVAHLRWLSPTLFAKACRRIYWQWILHKLGAEAASPAFPVSLRPVPLIFSFGVVARYTFSPHFGGSPGSAPPLAEVGIEEQSVVSQPRVS